MKNIMLDLEAFDSKRSAIIVSIGAVYFDLNTGEIGNTFYKEVSMKGIHKQYEQGRTFSFETFQWWMHQNDEARKVFTNKEDVKDDIVYILHEFSKFADVEKVKMWGNGVDYDNVVLRDCYETFNIKAPWTYSHNRCYRTIKNIFGNRAKLVREGTHHNGLADAITQAKHLIAMTRGVHVNE